MGYIIGATDAAGLARKFEVKHRAKNKPAVTLVGSLEQLARLAELSPEVLGFYEECWDKDILMGCILPWRKDAQQYLPRGSEAYVRDARRTSCCAVKYGLPVEQIAGRLWEEDSRLLYADPQKALSRGRPFHTFAPL